MRLDELVLRIPGDEFRVHFHEHLTVLCGIGLLERHALADSLLQALAGTAENTTLTYTDRTGRQVQVVSAGGTGTATYLDDGTVALPLVGTVTPTIDELRSLVLLQAADLGLAPARVKADDDPELAEARATLADLTRELHAAIGDRRDHDTHRRELEAIDAQLHHARDGADRREYAKVLAELERVKAEAAALHSGSTGAESDRHLIASVDAVRDLTEKWARAVADLEEARVRAAGEALEPEAVAELRDLPDEPPADLHLRLRAVDLVKLEHDRLDAELRELAAAAMAEPSRPEVIDLATVDQDSLWRAANRVEQADADLRREELALGGAGSHAGTAEQVTSRIEESQRVVEACEAVVEKRWTPTVAASGITAVCSLLFATVNLLFGPILLVIAVALLGVRLGLPWKELQEARAAQQSILDEAGAPTYLSFHLRRVDAAMDRDSHSRVEAAELEYRRATEAWNGLAPRVDVATARVLEAEARAFAAGLAQREGSVAELEARRSQLVHKVEPELRAARDALRLAVAPYRIDQFALDTDDLELVDQLVHRQVELGRHARAIDAADDAQADEEKAAAQLDELLLQLGFRDGTLDARAGALDWAAERAAEREQARRQARPRDEVEEDLARLQADVARLRRPEWASVEPADDNAPELDELERRHAELVALVSADDNVVIDLERLADRHSAMERRVAALEASHEGRTEETSIGQLADVQQFLLGHLTRAGHAGPFDESLPVVLDEPFLRIGAERKWELLDMLRRLAEKTQLLYLTDDPFVGAWARRRAAAGLVTLLEPVDA
jgi:hypothetical protein